MLVGKTGQVQFVRSTLRAVPANWTCLLFPTPMANDGYAHDRQQPGGHDPTLLVMVGQHGRDAAEDRNQREGPHAGHAAGGVFPLQADQQSEQDRNSQLLKHRLH